MGLFTPQYAKKHPIEWYYSEQGRKGYFNAAYDNKKLSYFINFVDSLPNLKKLEEFSVDTIGFAKGLLYMDEIEYVDKYGHTSRPKWASYENILDRTKNPFLDYIMRLNHSLYDATLFNIIFTMTIGGCFDFDGEDSWLFDADFWFDDKADKYHEFLKKLESFNISLDPSKIIEIRVDL